MKSFDSSTKSTIYCRYRRCTEQEERVLHLFAAGHTPGQVTRSLGISTQTLRNHLHHVNQKLGTHNRLEAVIHAVRRRLI
ncbi:MAG: response regulator transcription factor [Gemmatimonadaceae bacterium]|nr:response regulator transcription factor [Gemmatimonadaceae bacterium]